MQIKQLEYEQGPEGWDVHGDTKAISATNAHRGINANKGAVELGSFGPTEDLEDSTAQMDDQVADADPIPAAMANIDVVQKPSSTSPDTSRREHSTLEEHSVPVKKEPKFTEEPIVKREPSTVTTISVIPHQQRVVNASAAPEVAGKLSSTGQDARMQEQKRRGDTSRPIEDEPSVRREPTVKSERFTATTVDDVLDHGRAAKRRKITHSPSRSGKPDSCPKLFSSTIDMTGDIPIVEPKAAITIDLTVDSASSEVYGDVNESITPYVTRYLHPKRGGSPAASTADVSRMVKEESVQSTISRGIILDSINSEPADSSDMGMNSAVQPSMSESAHVRPTPTEIAEQGGCSIQ